MKKIFILIACATALWSCKKNSESNPDLENPIITKTKNSKTSSAGDGVWDLLGYGYDVTGEYGNSDAATYAVIDVAKLKSLYPTYVENSGSETSNPLFFYGENAESYSKSLSLKTKVTAEDSSKAKSYKGSIDASFDSGHKWSSRYVYSRYSDLIVKRRLKLMPLYDVLKTCLQQGFVDNVQSLTPQQIVQLYGTHVLSDIKLGGKIEISYQSETNSSDRNSASKAGIGVSIAKVFGFQANIDYTTSQAQSNFNQTLFVKTYGGNAQNSILKTITYGTGTPSTTIDISAWQSGVTDSNAELVDIAYDGLIPIYELVSDPTKKAALKSYVDQYIADNQVRCTTPIYRYYHPSYYDHFYSKSNVTPEGYFPEGIEFDAFSKQLPNTVPVYRYWKPGNYQDHYYTTTYGFYSGYQYEGIEFYAYPNQVNGSIPIYGYYNGPVYDHFYTRDPNKEGGLYGYSYEGIKWYGLP